MTTDTKFLEKLRGLVKPKPNLELPLFTQTHLPTFKKDATKKSKIE